MTILSMREKLQRVLGNVRIMRAIFGHFIPRPMRDFIGHPMHLEKVKGVYGKKLDQNYGVTAKLVRYLKIN